MSEKRSVFAEVGEGQATKSPQKGLIDGGRGGNAKAVRVWLWILFGLVVTMIAVGGLTRLTDSGLSITEWAPVTGAIPPLSPQDWQSEFDKYKQIPEYQLQNSGMSMSEFKVIYWWEWGHRQLGRVIGLVWFLGFVGLLSTRAIPQGWAPRLLLLGVLGGLQGAIGWWMVSSGLTGTMLDVASYRLATHLGLAFIILGLIFWYICLLGRERAELFQAQRVRNPAMITWANGLLALAFVQILLGALVAGLDAGRSYTDWPLMAGQFFPSTGWDLTPAWRNVFENAGLAQFNHRITGYIFGVLAVVAFLRSRKAANASIKSAFTAMHGLIWIQILWGIVTVVFAAPWYLAIVHQLLAVAIICLLLRAKFFASYPLPERIA